MTSKIIYILTDCGTFNYQHQSTSETYSGSRQTPKMEHFVVAEIANNTNLQLLTLFPKRSILDDCLGQEFDLCK